MNSKKSLSSPRKTHPRKTQASHSRRAQSGAIEDKAPRQSQANLQASFENHPQAFMLIDRQYRIRAFNSIANERAKAVVGKALQEGSPVHDFVPEHDRKSFRRNFTTALRGEYVRVEKSHADASHLERWFEFHYAPVLSSTGRVNEVFFSVLDITEHKNLEAMLRESEEQHRSLFTSSLDAIMSTRPDGRILAANPTACRMLGYTEEELRRLGRNGVVDATDPRLPALLAERARKGKVIGELTYKRKNGTRFPGEFSSVVFKDREGLQKMSTIIRDVTERRQTEKQLRDYSERLQMLSHQLLEVQENERRTVARELHDEIGQLLTGLKLTLATSLRLLADERKLNNAKQYIHQGMDLANDLIGRVRRLSLTLRPALLDELGLAPALTWLCERVGEQTQMRVTFAHEDMDRRFPLDVETAVYRIVQEALTNAARHAGASAAEVRLGNTRDRLKVEIRDQGKGFDPTILQTAKTNSGLAGMHERVTLLGGQLTLESAPEAGTRLIAYLPLSPRQEMEGDLAGDGEEKKTHRHRARGRPHSRSPRPARSTRG